MADGWKCKAGSLPNGEVQDCGYPDCGCDPEMTIGKAIVERWKQDCFNSYEALAEAIDQAIDAAETDAAISACRTVTAAR